MESSVTTTLIPVNDLLLSKGSPNSNSETTEEVACDSNTHTRVTTHTRIAS